MPKPVCMRCGRQYRCIKTGAKATERFELGKEDVYRIWSADIWACPGCEHQILHGYGLEPIAIHHQDDFKEKLEKAKASDAIDFF